MEQITKLCADSLRTFTNDKYGIKLKASHAHELVAAFLGYRSRAALLADTQFPINNLRYAEFIFFDWASAELAKQRLKDLQYPTLDAYSLGECFYSTLTADSQLSVKTVRSFHEIVVGIAKTRHHQRLKMLGINPSSLEWDIHADMFCWENNGGVVLTAEIGYSTDAGERLRDSSYTINLPRIAGNLGYGTPNVEEIRYSGLARKAS